MKKCDNENCKRQATISNNKYFKDKWYCTYHANILVKKGRIERKNKK